MDVETAKTVGRKQFGEMVRFFKQNKTCRVLWVEKTDRLYRNFRDYVTLEEVDIEVHLPKERADHQQECEVAGQAGPWNPLGDGAQLHRKLEGRSHQGNAPESGTESFFLGGRPSAIATTRSNPRSR